MQENTSFTHNVDTLFQDLQNFVKTEAVLGTPLTVEGKTLVPLMSVTLGYGSTGMGTRTQMGGNTNASSGGQGLGARISANGVIVVEKDSVQILATNESSKMTQMMDKLPQALSSMGQNMMGGGSQGQQGSSQAQQSSQQGTQQGAQKTQQSGQ